MKFKIVAKLTAPKKACLGCGHLTDELSYYETEPNTPWCKSCFVTEEQVESAKAQMPMWQELRQQRPKRRIKCTVVSRLSVPFD